MENKVVKISDIKVTSQLRNVANPILPCIFLILDDKHAPVNVGLSMECIISFFNSIKNFSMDKLVLEFLNDNENNLCIRHHGEVISTQNISITSDDLEKLWNITITRD